VVANGRTGLAIRLLTGDSDATLVEPGLIRELVVMEGFAACEMTPAEAIPTTMTVRAIRSLILINSPCE
jgi:hypothetical protein